MQADVIMAPFQGFTIVDDTTTDDDDDFDAGGAFFLKDFDDDDDETIPATAVVGCKYKCLPI